MSFSEFLFFHSCSSLFCLSSQCLQGQGEGVVKQKVDRGREEVENWQKCADILHG